LGEVHGGGKGGDKRQITPSNANITMCLSSKKVSDASKNVEAVVSTLKAKIRKERKRNIRKAKEKYLCCCHAFQMTCIPI
jgi:hypothetical protein